MNDWAKKLKLRLPAIVLLAATVVFWGKYDRFEVVDPAFLQSPSMADATRIRGDCTETNGHFILTVPSSGSTASINFRMPGATGYEMIRVRARVKVDGVVVGKRYWNCARLLLVQYDGNDRWIPGEHGVVSESGTKDWGIYEDVFEIVPKAVHADLVIQQTGKAGVAEYDQILAEPVGFKRTFIFWQAVFSALWVGMVILYYKRCRLDGRRLRVLILLNALAILAGTIMPSEWISDSSEQVKQTVVQTLERHETPMQDQTTARIDQFNEMVGGAHVAGHFLLFTMLSFLVYWSAALERQHVIYYFKVAFDILLFAAITESLQYLTLDRTATVVDWRIDLVGLSTGLALFLATRAIAHVVRGVRRTAS